MSAAEDLLELHLKAEKFCGYQREVQLIPGRKFRYDFWCMTWAHNLGRSNIPSKATAAGMIKSQVLVECQGGVWLKGKSGHSSGTGITRDCEKLSLAAIQGYRVIVCTPAQIKSGQAIAWIKQALS